MKKHLAVFCASTLLAGICFGAAASEQADLILRNGKVVTVDDRFTITQAIAIKGERVIATGKNAEIAKLAGPDTRTIDLKGKTVIPGLIDNHAHFMRAAEYWHREVRLDGVTSRTRALEMIAAKAKLSAPGEWVL
ncbi:MAG: amidohydrolase family protein, partial [Usitatibacter sp.]